ncbi:hypothetical protein RMCBS344292_07176 [Rhizopus microsporus]|nr:hypothetical protein RMCBS344292_07176 [Rhizopus microsporus]
MLVCLYKQCIKCKTLILRSNKGKTAQVKQESIFDTPFLSFFFFFSAMTLPTEQFKSLHFAWFVGHGLIILSCLISILLYPFSIFYRFAYISVILTYSIVLYNSYKPLQQGLPIKRMLLDENTQYFIISVYFLFTKKRLATLPPFIIYSSFHILEYAETELIPTLFPEQTQLQTRINAFRTKYYEQAMDLTSRYEVCGIMGLLLLGFFV